MLEDLIAKRAELEVSAADISRKPERAQNGKRRVAEDKYRNPSTGETWSGRGKTAKWLAAELANGKTKAEFRIQA